MEGVGWCPASEGETGKKCHCLDRRFFFLLERAWSGTAAEKELRCGSGAVTGQPPRPSPIPHRHYIAHTTTAGPRLESWYGTGLFTQSKSHKMNIHHPDPEAPSQNKIGDLCRYPVLSTESHSLHYNHTPPWLVQKWFWSLGKCTCIYFPPSPPTDKYIVTIHILCTHLTTPFSPRVNVNQCSNDSCLSLCGPNNYWRQNGQGMNLILTNMEGTTAKIAWNFIALDKAVEQRFLNVLENLLTVLKFVFSRHA